MCKETNETIDISLCTHYEKLSWTRLFFLAKIKCAISVLLDKTIDFLKQYFGNNFLFMSSRFACAISVLVDSFWYCVIYSVACRDYTS